jgi:hypothetical protein
MNLQARKAERKALGEAQRRGIWQMKYGVHG